jgi:ADP-heptose:LPS heptosyltransferase
MFKNCYPDYKVVLVGEEYEKTDEITSQDIDLSGQTNFEELKTLLFHSALHVDTEGGLVHLRHAIKGGKSVVLFGSTDEDFFGYSENINIRTKACPMSCEWMTINWAVDCINKKEPFVCMESITPEMVLKEIKNEWNEERNGEN